MISGYFTLHAKVSELQSQCQAQATQLEKALLTVQEEKDLVREVHTYVRTQPLQYSKGVRSCSENSPL